MVDEDLKGIKESGHLRKHDLTIKEVKDIEIFNQFSDDEALEVIETIKRFTEIIFRKYKLLLKKRSSTE